MKLIIAEKPSLARAIMTALETQGEHFTSCDSGEYYESGSYYCTSQFGHLFELKMPEDYDCNKEKNMWQYSSIPFFPEEYEYKVKKDCSKRVSTIKSLCKRADVDEIIHCGDPDREGQVLVDIVLEKVGNSKPVTRPQLNALTETAICEAFRKRESNAKYTNLHNEGLARSFMDFDYGINLSIYANIKTGAKPALNIGRVIGAICTEIYTRDMAIKKFVPEDFYKVLSINEGIKIVSKRKFSLQNFAEAQKYAKDLQSSNTTVQNIESKKVRKGSPKFFSQTSLQAALNKRYGYPPEETLKLAQSLYEKGYTSYPRTNTEYLSTAEKELVRGIIKDVDAKSELVFKDGKSIFDDSKIEGHTAIIPTGKIPSDLSEEERNCYDTILNRFKAVFCEEDCIYDKTVIELHNKMEDFTLTGEILVKKGWQKFEPNLAAEKSEDGDGDDILPPLTLGQKINTDFKTEKDKTKPPKHHTVESLGKWMQNPFRKKENTEDENYANILAGLEIGTEATRAGIIEKAQKKNYIQLKKSTYTILPRGVFLVEACKALGIDMSKEHTAKMGKVLKEIGAGKRNLKDELAESRAYISSIIQNDNETLTYQKEERAEIGACPLCGKPVLENSKGYGCSGYRDGCSFVIWKSLCGKSLNKNIAAVLLTGAATTKIDGFKSKAGKKFSARLQMKDDWSGVEMIFDK